MDMYQKREMRKNKKMDENAKSLPSTSINWYPRTYGKNEKANNRVNSKTTKRVLYSFSILIFTIANNTLTSVICGSI